MTPPMKEHPLLKQTRAAIASLPGADLWARVVDSGGVVRQPGARIHQPYMPSQCRATGWFLQEFGEMPALDLHWMSMEGWTSVWPIETVSIYGEEVVVSGPRGVLELYTSPRAY